MNIARDYLYTFDQFDDERGTLIPINGRREIPFYINRVFFIVSPALQRGNHAHLSGHQMIVVVTGSCVITLEDKEGHQSIRISDPAMGIYVPPNIKVTLSGFTDDCSICVLCSDYHHPGDIIDADDFHNT